MEYCRKEKKIRENYLMSQEVFIPTRLRFLVVFCMLQKKFIEIDADAFSFLSSEMIFVLFCCLFFGNLKCHSIKKFCSFFSFNSTNGSIHYYLSLKMQKEQIWSLYAISHTCIFCRIVNMFKCALLSLSNTHAEDIKKKLNF